MSDPTLMICFRHLLIEKEAGWNVNIMFKYANNDRFGKELEGETEDVGGDFSAKLENAYVQTQKETHRSLNTSIGVSPD